MKNYVVRLLLGVILGILIGYVTLGITLLIYNETKVCHYEPGGKVIVAEFGDGRFAIVRDLIKKSSSNPPPTNAVLYDQWDKEIIDPDVERYRVYDSDLYIVGENGYTILRYFQKVINSEDEEYFSSSTQEIFDNKKKFTKLK